MLDCGYSSIGSCVEIHIHTKVSILLSFFIDIQNPNIDRLIWQNVNKLTVYIYIYFTIGTNSLSNVLFHTKFP